jgi:hypothetical protein
MTLNELGQQLADLHRDLIRSHPPEVMTPTEAAEFIGCKVDTLQTWRKDGFGPPYSQPTARLVRYLRADVVA